MIADAGDRSPAVGPFDRVEHRAADLGDFEDVHSGRGGDVRAERHPSRRDVDRLFRGVDDNLADIAILPVCQRQRNGSAGGQVPAGILVVIERHRAAFRYVQGDRQEMPPVLRAECLFGEEFPLAGVVHRIHVGERRPFREIVRIEERILYLPVDPVQETQYRRVVFTTCNAKSAVVFRRTGQLPVFPDNQSIVRRNGNFVSKCPASASGQNQPLPDAECVATADRFRLGAAPPADDHRAHAGDVIPRTEYDDVVAGCGVAVPPKKRVAAVSGLGNEFVVASAHIGAVAETEVAAAADQRRFPGVDIPQTADKRIICHAGADVADDSGADPGVQIVIARRCARFIRIPAGNGEDQKRRIIGRAQFRHRCRQCQSRGENHSSGLRVDRFHGSCLRRGVIVAAGVKEHRRTRRNAVRQALSGREGKRDRSGVRSVTGDPVWRSARNVVESDRKRLRRDRNVSRPGLEAELLVFRDRRVFHLESADLFGFQRGDDVKFPGSGAEDKAAERRIFDVPNILLGRHPAARVERSIDHARHQAARHFDIRRHVFMPPCRCR